MHTLWLLDALYVVRLILCLHAAALQLGLCERNGRSQPDDRGSRVADALPQEAIRHQVPVLPMQQMRLLRCYGRPVVVKCSANISHGPSMLTGRRQSGYRDAAGSVSITATLGAQRAQPNPRTAG